MAAEQLLLFPMDAVLLLFSHIPPTTRVTMPPARVWAAATAAVRVVAKVAAARAAARRQAVEKEAPGRAPGVAVEAVDDQVNNHSDRCQRVPGALYGQK